MAEIVKIIRIVNVLDRAWGRIFILDNAGLFVFLVYLVNLDCFVYLVFLVYLVSLVYLVPVK